MKQSNKEKFKTLRYCNKNVFLFFIDLEFAVNFSTIKVLAPFEIGYILLASMDTSYLTYL